MKIRKATIKDFNQLKPLRKEFYLSETKGDPFSNPDWAGKPLSSLIVRKLRSSNFAYFIAEENSKIVGFAAGQIEKCPSFFSYRKRGHLFNLYVEKGYRKKGVGKKLSKEVMKWFRKKRIKWVMQLVYVKNKKAHRFHKNNGFKDYMITLNKLIK